MTVVSPVALALATAREQSRIIEEQLAAKYPFEFEWFLGKSAERQAELAGNREVVFWNDRMFVKWRAIELTIKLIDRPGR